MTPTPSPECWKAKSCVLVNEQSVWADFVTFKQNQSAEIAFFNCARRHEKSKLPKYTDPDLTDHVSERKKSKLHIRVVKKVLRTIICGVYHKWHHKRIVSIVISYGDNRGI